MKVLVIGSGGREHALVWKLRQSPRVKQIFCAPGNGGIAADATCLPADVKSLDSLVAVANQIQPDLTVIGPELALTLGATPATPARPVLITVDHLPIASASLHSDPAERERAAQYERAQRAARA